MESTQRAVTVVVKGYPRLSETFIAQEIKALEARGLRINIASLRRPTDRATHPVHAEIRAEVSYLPEYLHREPERVAVALRRCRRMRGYGPARRAWLSDLVRDPTPNRVRRFGQALVLAAEAGQEVGFLYAHFLHTPGSVARYASLLLGVPWACSAHAKDIWTTPAWEIRRKLRQCDWAVTCTAANEAYLRSVSEDPGKVSLVYHGLDFNRFDDPSDDPADPAGAPCQSGPTRILSVGRAVEKKGHDDLLRALALLPAGMDWRLVHIGGGELIPQLQSTARALGISDRVEWRGPRPHAEVLAAYRAADLFVLACRVARDGDRDGLPNVLLEAQSQRVPCVSTRVSGVPELIEDGVSGVLVEQKDPAALCRAIAFLIEDPQSRVRYGNAGFERVRNGFALAAGIDRLVRKFPPSVLPGEDRLLRTA